jgi:hypothetical protein
LNLVLLFIISEDKYKVIALKNKMRYELLLEQFQFDKSVPGYWEFKNSLNGIFSYIYHYTDIMYIESIDEEVLYNYIKFHCSQTVKENNFVKSVKDVKRFLIFLKNNKKVKQIPKVDLSLKSFIYGWSFIK